jgi:hypothetical protein
LAIAAAALFIESVGGGALALSVEHAATEKAAKAARPADATAVLDRMFRMMTPCVLVNETVVFVGRRVFGAGGHPDGFGF